VRVSERERASEYASNSFRCHCLEMAHIFPFRRYSAGLYHGDCNFRIRKEECLSREATRCLFMTATLLQAAGGGKSGASATCAN
jgi:hypothetical protein